MVVFLWSLAVFLASVFAGLISGVTLTPKYKSGKLALWWIFVGIVGFALALAFAWRERSSAWRTARMDDSSMKGLQSC